LLALEQPRRAREAAVEPERPVDARAEALTPGPMPRDGNPRLASLVGGAGLKRASRTQPSISASKRSPPILRVSILGALPRSIALPQVCSAATIALSFAIRLIMASLSPSLRFRSLPRTRCPGAPASTPSAASAPGCRRRACGRSSCLGSLPGAEPRPAPPFEQVKPPSQLQNRFHFPSESLRSHPGSYLKFLR